MAFQISEMDGQLPYSCPECEANLCVVHVFDDALQRGRVAHICVGCGMVAGSNVTSHTVPGSGARLKAV